MRNSQLQVPNSAKILPTQISNLNKDNHTITDKESQENDDSKNMNANYFLDHPDQMIFTNIIKKNLEKDEMDKTSIRFYEKYKSLRMAADETKKKYEFLRYKYEID
jgi:hypothetical protein